MEESRERSCEREFKLPKRLSEWSSLSQGKSLVDLGRRKLMILWSEYKIPALQE